MSKLGAWVTSTAQNLFANAIWACCALACTGAAVLLAKLTPAVQAFAPFSYLVALLLVASLALCVAIGAVNLWRHFHPMADASATLDLSAEPPHRDTELQILADSFAENVTLVQQQIAAVRSDLARNDDKMANALVTRDAAMRPLFVFLRNEIARLRELIRKNAAETFAKWDGAQLSPKPDAQFAHARTEWRRSRSMELDQITRSLRALGVSDAAIQEAIDVRQKSVQTDTDYILLKEGEPWESAAEKKEYYMARVRRDALASLLGSLSIGGWIPDVMLLDELRKAGEGV